VLMGFASLRVCRETMCCAAHHCWLQKGVWPVIFDLCVCARVRMCVCVRVRMCVCVRVYACVCMCVNAHKLTQTTLCCESLGGVKSKDH
jgi:hypothetical protein